jgi:para-aminobenzoate synthetase component 2
MNILLIDNYDSFTFNLKHQVARISGADIDVIKYDNVDLSEIGGYACIFISPGPGHPADYPFYEQLLASDIPVIGVCLGMQILNCFYGGKVSRLKDCIHGHALQVSYQGKQEEVAVYNSLYCEKVPECFEVTAFRGKVPMAIKHKKKARVGVQFHPESFLTENGDKILNDALISSGVVF